MVRCAQCQLYRALRAARTSPEQAKGYGVCEIVLPPFVTLERFRRSVMEDDGCHLGVPLQQE